MLEKKKAFVARLLNVGKGRIKFDSSRLDEIKEALTRQDIRDLVKEKAIIILPPRGRKKIKKKKKKRGAGKIKKKVKKRKRIYIQKIRQIRKYISVLKKEGRVSSEEALRLRRLAKAGMIDIKKLKELYTRK